MTSDPPRPRSPEVPAGAPDAAWGSRFRVLTFDCYGTLIDWERGLLDALATWRRRTRVAADDEGLLAAFAERETVVQGERPTAPYPDVLAEVLRRMATALGTVATEDEARAFGRSVGDWPPFPDTPAALRELQRSRRLVVVSNVDRASFTRSAAHLGVAFDALVCAEEVGAYKPDPRMFDAALRTAAELGAAPDQVLHVAQSLFHDHAPAQRRGLATAWIDRRAGRAGCGATPPVDPGLVRPDLVVPSLEALAAHLRAPPA